MEIIRRNAWGAVPVVLLAALLLVPLLAGPDIPAWWGMRAFVMGFP
jgi:hypothetical protein